MHVLNTVKAQQEERKSYCSARLEVAVKNDSMVICNIVELVFFQEQTLTKIYFKPL